MWHDPNSGNTDIPQSKGWYNIWRLTVPHKVKIFVWRFCRNNLPARIKLKAKGVALPIVCPMCNIDIEHLLQLFFDCNHAKSCWQHVDSEYDMSEVSEVLSAPEWLLSKLEGFPHSEAAIVCTVLYGIWWGRNEKIWENKLMPGSVNMEICFR